jgi:hypothetical protein
MQIAGQPPQRLFQLASTHPLLETAMAGLERRILFRQLAPLRPGSEHPEHAVKNRARIVPRAAAVVSPPRRTQHRFNQFPLFISKLPPSSHRPQRSIPEHPRMPRLTLSGVYETGSRLLDALDQAIAAAIATITPQNSVAWFHHCGYRIQLL